MVDEDEGPAVALKSKNEITDVEGIEKMAPKLEQTHLDSLDTFSEFG